MLFDQLLKNLRAPVQAGVDLRARMLAVRVPNEKVSGALQKREQNDEVEEQPALEPAEAKFQR